MSAKPTIYECDTCEFKGFIDELDDIDEVLERVLIGELMAAGQCPECGALMSVHDNDVPDYVLKDCVRLAKARGLIAEPADLRPLVAMGRAVVEDFMPNIRNCALQDYARLNTFLIESDPKKIDRDSQT